MMAYSEDHIALAAEYALGTLDADERAQVETMMSVDKEFTAMVEAWQQKLGALNQMVGSVEPRPEVWDRIKTAIGHSEPQSPLVLPDAPPPPPPPIAFDVSELAATVDTVQRRPNCPPGRGAGATWRPSRRRLPRPWSRWSPPSSMRRIGFPTAFARSVRTQVVEVKTPVAPTPSGAVCRAAAEGQQRRPPSFSRWMAPARISRCAGSARPPSPARASSCGWSPTSCSGRVRWA